MATNIRLLEDLVSEAVGRLEGLTRERDGLREELAALRERLDALELEASRGDRQADAGRAWQATQAQGLALAREALSELRDE